MIKKFTEIKNFGVFQNFDWNNIVKRNGTSIPFKKLNILYGRNYAGKTTLSRLLGCLQNEKLPNKNENAEFKIEFYDDSIVTHNNISLNNELIRVYNKDFVTDNLKWLTDEEGEIKPFAIIGDKNVEIENKITEKTEIIGSVETEKGLKHTLVSKKAEFSAKSQQRKDAENFIKDKLRWKANQKIKTNPIYKNVNYNINNIENDIKTVLKTSFSTLDSNEIDSNKKILKENPKNKIDELSIISLDLNNLYQKVIDILSIEIKPTKPIQDLINNALLEDWVRKGRELHKVGRENCAFCGNILPENLQKKLDEHFNLQSEELRLKLKNILVLTEEFESSFNANIDSYLDIKSDSIYSVFHSNLSEQKEIIKNNKKEILKTTKELKQKLIKREKEIFNSIILPKNYNTDLQNIINCQKSINKLIRNSNAKTATLSDDQSSAINKLRLTEIYNFIETINYKEKKIEISALKIEEEKKKTDYLKLKEQIEEIEEEIKVLNNSLNDEKKGAEKINDYLNHFFGNKHLELIAEQNGETSYKFVIKRDNKSAYNLSEGERSLIAFCYFLAKLKDADTQSKKPIIWIDDPISSLDNNHIFFIYSLIESLIATPATNSAGDKIYIYEQLFISTHNLDFLKYLKRLSKPNNNSEYFIIERKGNEISELSPMPKYLKNYITEFNYLFHQIYKAGMSQNIENHDLYYNFGNNLRKFLEAYLFYKYPNLSKERVKMTQFFGNDNTAIEVANRLNNELSHLESIFDRSMRPIEVPEIPKLARYVLNRIKEKDIEQFEALLKSIDISLENYELDIAEIER
ncbi:AAA family ATPase [Winogradskyella psychrotolerans]|uniref:AAA family ATPase n=1 Tax=Winogradskyella psychrotolerans TaxID=1344585 RepID=UPI001C07C9B7|nr:AAA family ATPase [Winogradskyella psychrotolerans]MBU2929742.1 AAA family ATPase [Winogradskyella psychrotolerans]